MAVVDDRRFQLPVEIHLRDGFPVDLAEILYSAFGSNLVGVWTTDDEEPETTRFPYESGRNWDVSLAENLSDKAEIARTNPEWQEEFRFWDGWGLAVGGTASNVAIGGNNYAKNVNIANVGAYFLSIANGDWNSAYAYLLGWNKSSGNPSFKILLFVNGRYEDEFGLQGRILWRDYQEDEDEPYGETSEPSDNKGDYDNKSDIIDTGSSTIITDGGSVTVPFPSVSAIGTGLINVWKLSLTRLQALGAELWSSDFINNIVKSFLSPMDSIVSLNLVPSINRVYTYGEGDIVLGNYNTHISANKVATQFIDVDMGTYTFKEFFGSALDYSPYTTIQLYLPYIGYVNLSPDDVMGKTIHVVYVCDIITGQLVARVYVNIDNVDSLLYTFIGNFSMTLPITGANFSEVYKGIISGSAGLVAGLSGAGAGAAMVAGGGVLASSTVNSITSGKTSYQNGSSTSMTGGYLATQFCYLVISRPRQSLAVDYNKFQGYPSNITDKLSNLSGFTSVESIHLENVPATDTEITEIESLLKEGVII